MYFDSALNQFKENAQLFGSDPKNQTEKFNFYNGLANICEGLKDLEISINRIEQRLEMIENKIK